MDYIFVYRIKDSDDRDCCAYIERKYSNYIGICGACYSGGHIAKYEDVETVLSKKDFETLFSNKVSLTDFNRIIKKLTNEKGTKFFESIQESEMELLKENYDLTDNDIEKIFKSYKLDYKDRAVVGSTYADMEEFGEEEFWQCGYDNSIPNEFKDCIDYEKIGEKFFEWQDCVELNDGRIVTLMY